MKAHELASYFAKKIAKPITYTVEEIAEHDSRPPVLAYSIEPVAVSDDNVLHALVTLKSRTIKRGTVKLPKAAIEAEVDVPFKDGDNLTLVLIMAIAEVDEGEDLLRLPKDDYRRRAYELLQERLVEWKEDRPRPRM
jgi:hypothetical protein